MIHDYAADTTYLLPSGTSKHKVVPENVELQPYDEKPSPQIPREKKKKEDEEEKETIQRCKRILSKFAAKKAPASPENVGLGVGTLVLRTEISFLH